MWDPHDSTVPGDRFSSRAISAFEHRSVVEIRALAVFARVIVSPQRQSARTKS